MPIINNNVGNVKFLRNGSLYADHSAALSALQDFSIAQEQDGTIILARYGSGNNVKTLAGLVYYTTSGNSITILDVEGASGDVEKLRQEINAKLGEGVTSANTATAQLAALSGTSSDASGVTSVWGAKAYADDLISNLDYEDAAVEGQYVSHVTQADGKIAVRRVALPTVAAISEAGKPITAVSESLGEISASAGTINSQYVTVTGFTAQNVQGALEEIENDYKAAISGLDYSDTTVEGQYVSQVTETDGVISVTRVELPSSADTAQAKKVVIAVSENKGQIEVSRGTISSSAETMVLSDNADGGVNFEVNIDNNTIIQDAETKKLKVADAALVQYEGDTKTIAISPVQGGVRTVSTLLTLSSVTPSSTTVKEEYALKNASGETIGSTIKIYKDSSLVSIKYITDPADLHYQNLEYVYVDNSGNTQTAYVDMSTLVLEAEFESGVTADASGVVHGVVDSQSETFLTVGTNGFKLSGVQDAIDAAVADLDATVNNSGNSGHVGVEIVETDGKLVSVTVSEDDIASADDVEGLSAKTITDIKSANGSITVTPGNAADGTKEIDIVTDASKIKMSGFTSAESGFTGITEATSITDAFKVAESAFTEAERVTAAALTDLNGRVDTVSGKVDTIEAQYVSGVSVNGSAVTVANHVAPISISAATSATTTTGTNAITVQTDANGNITLGLATIDAGLY